MISMLNARNLVKTRVRLSICRAIHQKNPIDNTHNPAQFEANWYKTWESVLESNLNNNDKRLFSMILPPPNITGTLHLGHAITATIQDVIVRWKMMNGYRTVWVPGYDHAGIATQVVVERKIWNEKRKTRHDLGREEFINEVYRWKDSKMDVIKNQMIKLNALVNWNYEYFTMNEKISNSVTEAFIQLHEKDLIVRALRPINWCCTLKSAISDIEIENKAIDKPTKVNIPNYKYPIEVGQIHSFAYPIHNSNEKIVVATTRPETMFGDMAVAVHPSDTRYSNLNGKYAVNPLTDELMPIIFDENVDQNFHTGAVKITPSHDFNDYEMAQRHDIKNFKTILNDEGRLENVPKEYHGLHRFEARRVVLDKLKSLGLYHSSKPNPMTLPICSRTGDIIEPMLKEQWFVRTEKMFKESENLVRNGTLKLIPKWRENLWLQYTSKFTKDWCISRQLWWGQQIPAFKCTPSDASKSVHKWFAARNVSEARQKAVQHFKTDNIKIEQDNDVFDTWFSSTLLPLAILNWPNCTPSGSLDFEKIYPTNLLETGYDIMFFWVLRMVAMCHTLSGQVPFREVLFHGLILDSQGRKMSKSIGNVIDPMDLIDGATLDTLKKRIETSNLDEKEKKISLKNQEVMYPKGINAIGSDALRLGLLVQEFQDDSMNIDVNTFTTSKHYCNKIWQANRFVNMFVNQNENKLKQLSLSEIVENKNYGLIDKWIVNRLAKTVNTIELNFSNEYNLHGIILSLRTFFLSDFCDFYIEYSKLYQTTVSSDDADCKAAVVWNLLKHCMDYVLRLYHPIIPCLTDELWQHNNGPQNQVKSILQLQYPKSSDIQSFEDENIDVLNQTIDTLQKLVSSVLNTKKTLQIKEKPKLYVEFVGESTEVLRNNIVQLSEEILHLSKSTSIKFETPAPGTGENLFLTKISDHLNLYVKFEQKIDYKLQLDRLLSQLNKKQKELHKINEKILKVNYLNKTAVDEQKTDKKLIDECKETINKLNETVEMIKNSNL